MTKRHYMSLKWISYSFRFNLSVLWFPTCCFCDYKFRMCDFGKINLKFVQILRLSPWAIAILTRSILYIFDIENVLINKCQEFRKIFWSILVQWKISCVAYSIKFLQLDYYYFFQALSNRDRFIVWIALHAEIGCIATSINLTCIECEYEHK